MLQALQVSWTFFSEPLRVKCLLKPITPTYCVHFLLKKIFLPYHHYIVTKIRKSTLRHHYHLIFRACSGSATWPGNVLYSRKVQVRIPYSFLKTTVLPQSSLDFDGLDPCMYGPVILQNALHLGLYKCLHLGYGSSTMLHCLCCVLSGGTWCHLS